jgi:hypothetical protein
MQFLEPRESDASSGHGFTISLVCDIPTQR